MTKKISKKNLFCLFPSKPGKFKGHEYIQLGPSTQKSANHSTSDYAELNFSPEGECTSDWQSHYDFLEIAGWGSGLFGAPMDREIEEIALSALKLAIKSGDRDKIAKSYRHLFYLYCEFNHPDTLAVGFKSVAAAVNAYGQSTSQVGEEVAMLAVVHEFNNNHDLEFAARDASIKIFEKCGTTERIFEALEMAICSASDIGRGDKAEEYARRGISLIKERCKKGSEEYSENMDYFEHMLETAHEPPIPIEEQRRQLLAMFPKLLKAFEGEKVEKPPHMIG